MGTGKPLTFFTVYYPTCGMPVVTVVDWNRGLDPDPGSSNGPSTRKKGLKSLMFSLYGDLKSLLGV
jgi:hypothetical protein